MSYNFLLFNEKPRKDCGDEVIYSIMASGITQQINVDPELPCSMKIKLKWITYLNENTKL